MLPRYLAALWKQQGGLGFETELGLLPFEVVAAEEAFPDLDLLFKFFLSLSTLND